MVKRVVLGCAALCVAFAFIPALPAGAQAPARPTSVPPGNGTAVSGPCKATGTWVKSGQVESSTQHKSSDTITVPQKDTVLWFGNENDSPLGTDGAERPIKGSVVLDLPVGSATIDDWGNDSTRYANNGEHSYNLPSFLVGIKMKLHGEHLESGKPVCTGSVYVKVAGSAPSNPIFWAAIVVMTIGLLLSIAAGRPVFKKTAPAFEDINPG